jgi:hypothetical protein
MGPGLGLGMGMGGMGMGGGPGFGPRPRSPDDIGLEKERTRGRLGASGEINEVKTFKGMPTEGESKVLLRDMVQSATQDAEEALGQEEVPRKRREAVKKYFEGVKPK